MIRGWSADLEPIYNLYITTYFYVSLSLFLISFFHYQGWKHLECHITLCVCVALVYLCTYYSRTPILSDIVPLNLTSFSRSFYRDSFRITLVVDFDDNGGSFKSTLRSSTLGKGLWYW